MYNRDVENTQKLNTLLEKQSEMNEMLSQLISNQTTSAKGKSPKHKSEAV